MFCWNEACQCVTPRMCDPRVWQSAMKKEYAILNHRRRAMPVSSGAAAIIRIARLDFF
jgi:hypothetical protein